MVSNKTTIEWYGRGQDIGIVRVHLKPFAGYDKYSWSVTIEDHGNGVATVHGSTTVPTPEEKQEALEAGRKAGFREVLWERAPRPGRPPKFVRLTLN